MSLQDLGYAFEEFTMADLNDEELQPIVDLTNKISKELQPRHSNLSVDEVRIFMSTPGRVRRNFVVRDSDGNPVARASLSHRDDGTIAELLSTSIEVAPEHRRRGIGSELLKIAAGWAGEMGRPTLEGAHLDTVEAGAAFAAAFGTKDTIEFHMNSVQVSKLPIETLTKWLAEGPGRAPAYSVEVIAGGYPDRLLAGIAHLYVVLERDMPHPDTWEPRAWTPELVREQMDHYLAGTEVVTAVAYHTETGEAAGMSQIMRRKADPKTWFVTVTMVDPAHRGHALGKWVKAAVTLQASRDWQGAEWMETGNAFTNEAMLGINHAMGFVHEFTMTTVEVEVDRVEGYLSDR